MNATRKRYRFIINVIYFAIIIGAIYILFDRFLSLFMPLLVAGAIAMVLKKPISFLDRKTPFKRGLVSVVLVLFLLCFGIALVGLLGFKLVVELKGFVTYAYERISDLPQLILAVKNWILGVLANLPASFGSDISATVASFFDNLAENGLAGIKVSPDMFNWSTVLSTGGDILTGTIGRIPTLLISVVITIISTVFICTDYVGIRDFVFRQFSPENGEKLMRAKQICVTSMLKMIKAYGLIFIITTVEMSIAFSVLKLIGVYKSDYLFVMALLIAVVDIIPVLGTGTILIPWGVVSLLTGKIGLGIGLLVTYAVVLVIRQILEPKLVSGQIGLPPIVTITSMYIGTKTLGIFGFFILPFFVTILNELNKEGIIHLFKVKNKPDSSAEDEQESKKEQNVQIKQNQE